jgi:4'-phosphopantetheinyl transferase
VSSSPDLLPPGSAETTPDHAWRVAPEELTLTSGDVHVWRARLQGPEMRRPRLALSLSPDEQRRAHRFHFERDRWRFIAGRWTLRTILGRYLECDPARIQFSYGAHGKPELAPTHGDSGLRFNCSHSEEIALYAVTRGRAVGIDVEAVRPISDADTIAEHFFSPGERATLRALPSRERQEAFLHCWTRKEAYLKAVGCGLADPPERVEVTLAPGDPARLQSADADLPQPGCWGLQALPPANGYVSALAVEGHGWRLACWQFVDPGT